MHNQVQFICLWCCVPPHFVVQINNFFRLTLFSAVIDKRRRKKLIIKIIKYKINSSSEIQFVFFYPKYIQKFFFEKLSSHRKSQNDANSSKARGESCSLRHYDAMRTKIDI